MSNVIIVSGTPATGKTTISKELSNVLDYEYIDGKKIIKDNNLDSEFDEKRNCHIIDLDKFEEILVNKIKSSNKNIIIDSHLAHEMPSELVDLVIITTCDRKILSERMKEREYSAEKIKENIEAEIFDTCNVESLEAGHTDVIKVDTTSEVDYSKLKTEIDYILKIEK